MITHHKVDGYENFQKLMYSLDGKGDILILFCGSKNSLGVSWCPDCNEAEPAIMKVIEENEEKNFHFIHVGVGGKPEWLDSNNPFKWDKRLIVGKIPMLVVWRSRYRLMGPSCKDERKIKSLLDVFKLLMPRMVPPPNHPSKSNSNS